MELEENVFTAEELCFRFACMPEEIQEEIVRSEDFKQHLVTAILDYKQYFSDRLGSEQAADDRFESLCRQAANIRATFTRRYHEILQQTGLEQRNSMTHGYLQSARRERGPQDMFEQGAPSATAYSQMASWEDVESDDLRGAGGQQNLDTAQLRRIFGDDDYELETEATGNSLLDNHRQELNHTDLCRILGDNDYTVEQDRSESGRHPEEFGPAQIRRILVDDNFEKFDNQDARHRRNIERPTKVRRHKDDGHGPRRMANDENALRHLQIRLREVQDLGRQRHINIHSRR